MWIIMKDAFLSIVEPEKVSPKSPRSAMLLVRARLPRDIGAVFPDARVIMTPERDYMFRAFIDRRAVALAIADRLTDVDYHNFKGSVHETERHDAYMDVWAAMNRIQPNRKPGRRQMRNHGTGGFDFY